MSQRLAECFARLRKARRSALISFLMAGDPNMKRCEALLQALPGAGADIVELGMPFSDPGADGPSIQAAGLRALKAGTTLKTTLALAGRFRKKHPAVPLVLMGYYNPILHYGPARFAKAAAKAGVDGVIVVDLPPEEENELRIPLDTEGVSFIRLIAPTTGDARLKKILRTASGFVYTIAVKGITGTRSATASDLTQRITHIQRFTHLPVVAGFGIKTPKQAAALSGIADGVVIGSALVEKAARSNKEALAFIRALAKALQK